MYKIKKSRLLQKDNKGESEKMGVVSTKNQFSANIMKFLAIFFLENRPFLRQFLPEPNYLLSPFIFSGN